MQVSQDKKISPRWLLLSFSAAYVLLIVNFLILERMGIRSIWYYALIYFLYGVILDLVISKKKWEQQRDAKIAVPVKRVVLITFWLFAYPVLVIKEIVESRKLQK